MMDRIWSELVRHLCVMEWNNPHYYFYLSLVSLLDRHEDEKGKFFSFSGGGRWNKKGKSNKIGNFYFLHFLKLIN